MEVSEIRLGTWGIGLPQNRAYGEVNQFTAKVHRKETQQGINPARVEGHTGWVERGEKKKAKERLEKKTKQRQTAFGKQAHMPNHINTDWRTDGERRVL